MIWARRTYGSLDNHPSTPPLSGRTDPQRPSVSAQPPRPQVLCFPRADVSPPRRAEWSPRSTLGVTGPAARSPAEARRLPTRFSRARRWSRGEQDSTCRARHFRSTQRITRARGAMTVPSAMAIHSLPSALDNQRPIRADPSPRRDGRCPCCGSERPDVAVENGDSFCSTGCARGWHDQLATPQPTSRQPGRVP